MQTVSPTYNPYPRERWSNASVVFGLVDIDAKDHAYTVSNRRSGDIQDRTNA